MNHRINTAENTQSAGGQQTQILGILVLIFIAMAYIGFSFYKHTLMTWYWQLRYFQAHTIYLFWSILSAVTPFLDSLHWVKHGIESALQTWYPCQTGQVCAQNNWYDFTWVQSHSKTINLFWLSLSLPLGVYGMYRHYRQDPRWHYTKALTMLEFIAEQSIIQPHLAYVTYMQSRALKATDTHQHIQVEHQTQPRDTLVLTIEGLTKQLGPVLSFKNADTQHLDIRAYSASQQVLLALLLLGLSWLESPCDAKKGAFNHFLHRIWVQFTSPHMGIPALPLALAKYHIEQQQKLVRWQSIVQRHAYMNTALLAAFAQLHESRLLAACELRFLKFYHKGLWYAVQSHQRPHVLPQACAIVHHYELERKMQHACTEPYWSPLLDIINTSTN